MKLSKIFLSVLYLNYSNYVKSITITNNIVDCNSTDYDCGNGLCINNTFNTTVGRCDCNAPYANTIINTIVYPCDYKQKKQLEAFLLSFFVGWLGVDWFYLARGDAGYIVAGVFKLITAGGFGIWWLVDWIRILCDVFNDGNNVALYPF